MVVPVVLDWQTACRDRGEAHPERCPRCGRLLVRLGVILRASGPPPGDALRGAGGMTHVRGVCPRRSEEESALPRLFRALGTARTRAKPRTDAPRVLLQGWCCAIAQGGGRRSGHPALSLNSRTRMCVAWSAGRPTRR